MANKPTIPEQPPISWAIAFGLSMTALRRRFLRSLITMGGVILAIAFVSYMLISDNLTQALVRADQDELNTMLQNAEVDIFSGTTIDQMTVLLICLSLVTCTVGIVNSMLMAVTERVKEIGTLKCLGASDKFIVKTYFIESSLQGIIGAVIGLCLGGLVALAAGAYNYHGYVFRFLPLLPILKASILSFLIGTIMAVVASIGPAYMAARKEPVEALRVEE